MTSMFRARPNLVLYVSCFATLFSLLFLGTGVAYACNAGTTSGNNSTLCSVSWDAKTIMSSALTNDDAEYPGLMVDYETGQPVYGGAGAYTNGGYIQDVNKLHGDPGIMEIMHFYVGSGSSLTQVWRIAVATDYTMLSGKLTFTLPQEVVDAGCPVSFDPSSTNTKMSSWGGNYALYKWLDGKASAIDNNDDTWIVDLGDLPRGQATVFQFNVSMGQTSYTPADRFVASAHLGASYAPGNNGGRCPDIADLPPRPTLTGSEPCEAEFVGQTVWTLYDRDITERYKSHGADTNPSDLMGEVNADGWGAGADAWGEGSERTFRLYAATKKELINAEWIVDAIQGFTFKTPVGEVSYDSPAAGKLQSNGYTGLVEGVTVQRSADGKRITVHVDRMAENSSISFNMGAILDGSKKTMVANHSLKGSLSYCTLNPLPVVEYGEWVDTDKSCSTKTVEQVREVTTTSYVWDPTALEYVLGESVTTTEKGNRPMTEEEAKLCETPEKVIPQPISTDSDKNLPPTPVPKAEPEKNYTKVLAKTGDRLNDVVITVAAFGVIGAAIVLVSLSRKYRKKKHS